MIAGIGIDIVHLAVVRRIVESRNEELLREVFTEAEIDLCRSSLNAFERFATRYAAKEAAMKALGLGWHDNGLDWTDIEVSMDDAGHPKLNLMGKAEEQASKLGVKRNWISLSHEEGIAVAMVVLES